jgi:hypothetical protein
MDTAGSILDLFAKWIVRLIVAAACAGAVVMGIAVWKLLG